MPFLPLRQPTAAFSSSQLSFSKSIPSSPGGISEPPSKRDQQVAASAGVSWRPPRHAPLLSYSLEVVKYSAGFDRIVHLRAREGQIQTPGNETAGTLEKL